MGAWTSTLTLAVAVTLVVKCWRPLIVVTDDVGGELPLLLLLLVLLELQSLAELCDKKNNTNILVKLIGNNWRVWFKGFNDSYLIGRVSGRVATAVAVAGRRLDDDFGLDDNFVRRSPRRRLFGDGRQRQVGAA